MSSQDKKIESALISVFHKEKLDAIISRLADLDIRIYSTGGTYDYVVQRGYSAIKVEDVTGFPEVFDGRVKTLHPKIFGGILFRRDHETDRLQAGEHFIPPIDLVIVDLYPFEKTLAAGASEQDIIEKIDIGGISLIRAAAKNYRDVLVVPSTDRYDDLIRLLDEKKGLSDLDERKRFAVAAFEVSSRYDAAILAYFSGQPPVPGICMNTTAKKLRYGENPHQSGIFYGNIGEVFEQVQGKEISYNNFNDIEAAVNLMADLGARAFAIIKHSNACGAAVGNTLKDAWTNALAGDPVSAFGGVLAANCTVDEYTAEEINKIFFEVIVAPGYEKKALELLCQKKNRIILQLRGVNFPQGQFKSLLNGMLWQEKDHKVETSGDLIQVTLQAPTDEETGDLLFANVIVKHTKSNAIVLAKNRRMCGSGMGQTSRVDALKQAIAKAREYDLDLQGAVMASDAFFPFADCVEIAHRAGIRAVIQPGGSVRDQESIDYCNRHGLAMVFTGIRHFKH